MLIEIKKHCGWKSFVGVPGVVLDEAQLVTADGEKLPVQVIDHWLGNGAFVVALPGATVTPEAIGTAENPPLANLAQARKRAAEALAAKTEPVVAQDPEPAEAKARPCETTDPVK